MATRLGGPHGDDAVLRSLVAGLDDEAIANLAGRDRLVLTHLMALTLVADELLGWRAVWALGVAAARVAARETEFVRNILRRLAWSLNDESGSIGWRAPQAMGAILAASPHTFPEFVPLVVSLLGLKERSFLPGVLWALGYMAACGVEGLEAARAHVRASLMAPEAPVRGLAAWCVGMMGDEEAAVLVERMQGDAAPVEYFDGRELRVLTVSELATAALRQIGTGQRHIRQNWGVRLD